MWFEAVIGYLSASIEWSNNHDSPDAWRDCWYDPAAKTVYFIGKDNIPFHAVIWPAELLGHRAPILKPTRQKRSTCLTTCRPMNF